MSDNLLAGSSNSSSTSTPSAVQNMTKSQATLTDELLKHEVPCETKDGEKVFVRVALMHQSRTFKTMWEDLNITTLEQIEDFNFPVKAISTKIFKKVVDWMEEHVDKPVPVVEEDPSTRERIWFTMSDWETNFFKVETDELAQLLVAGNFLDIPSLYLFGCQSMAALIKDKTPQEIRDMFGLEDDLTEEEKAEIRKKNVWCNY